MSNLAGGSFYLLLDTQLQKQFVKKESSYQIQPHAGDEKLVLLVLKKKRKKSQPEHLTFRKELNAFPPSFRPNSPSFCIKTSGCIFAFLFKVFNRIKTFMSAVIVVK